MRIICQPIKSGGCQHLAVVDGDVLFLFLLGLYFFLNFEISSLVTPLVTPPLFQNRFV